MDINAQRIAAVDSFVRRLQHAHETNDAASDVSSMSSDVPEQSGDTARAPAPLERARLSSSHDVDTKEIERIPGTERGVLAVEEQLLKDKNVSRVTACTGNKMLDQFEPWYFGIAFSFLIKYCTGMPDRPEFVQKPRYRRDASAPHVSLNRWVTTMARRVESSISRDWLFGFVSWNLMFRSAVN